MTALFTPEESLVKVGSLGCPISIAIESSKKVMLRFADLLERLLLSEMTKLWQSGTFRQKNTLIVTETDEMYMGHTLYFLPTALYFSAP